MLNKKKEEKSIHPNVRRWRRWRQMSSEEKKKHKIPALLFIFILIRSWRFSYFFLNIILPVKYFFILLHTLIFICRYFPDFFFCLKGNGVGKHLNISPVPLKPPGLPFLKDQIPQNDNYVFLLFFFRPEMIGSRWKEICWWVRIITMREIIFFENVMLVGLICLRLGANLCLTESLIFVILFPDYFVECCRTSGRCFWMCAGHRKTQDNWLRLIFDDIFLVNLWKKRLWPKLSCVMKRREQKESFSPFFKKKNCFV